jgi:1,2-diacylglycerol 3-beta-glucosyltransferase
LTISASDLALSMVALPVLAASMYLAALALLARRKAPPRGCVPRLKFDVVIPAHNEEAGISATVGSALGVDYPRRLFRVVVVADNCSDATAERALTAGSEVLVRRAPRNRGKGQALAYALDKCLTEGFADVIVVVDADTVVSDNLLSALAARFERGAAAVQADYRVGNVHSSWRTRLMNLAFTGFHSVRSLARERLGVSCGLRGNGMAFTTDTLHSVPYGAFSIVEDLEYGIALGRAGIRVEYMPEATVSAEMCHGEHNSRSQRRRWESGRSMLARRYARALLIESWHRRDRVLLDLALDLLVLPVAQVVALIFTGSAICAVASSLDRSIRLAPWLWYFSTIGVATYVGRACALSGTGLRGVLDLVWAPAYIVWKLTLPFRTKRLREHDWIRTTRETRIEAPSHSHVRRALD